MTRSGKTISTKRIFYKISEIGVSYFEGASKFQRIHSSFGGINITNIQGVTVIGNGNVIVNSSYKELFNSLEVLDSVIRRSDALTDEEKLDYIADINTIKSQLAKKNPDKDIIKKVWDKLKNLSSVITIANALEQVAKYIATFL